MANPPDIVERPRVAGEQALGDGRRRQQRSAPLGERLERRAAARPRAPRPAMNTGRRRRAQRVDERGHVVGVRRVTGWRRGRRQALGAGRTSAACTSSGRSEHDGAPLVPRRRTAAAASATAVSADVTAHRHRADRRGQAGWSTKKFDRGCVASAASTTIGVRLFAASVIPVMRVGEPAPLVHGQRGHRAAHPGVGVGHRGRAALVRAATYRAPAATIALVTWKLPRPDDAERPASTPSAAERPRPTASCDAVISARRAPARAPGCRSRRRSAAARR